ncbi:MAG: LPP20 family lipoprotein [Balneolaceae bacterium]
MKKYNLITFLSIVFLGLIITSCGSSNNLQNNATPDWADNPGDFYSHDKYLLAVGSGSTLNEATSDAFASLSQIFQINIDAREELYDEFVETSKNNTDVFTEGTTKLLNNVIIGTNQELLNTSILESQVGGNGTYYALAGMDRMESGRIYSQEISNNSLKINDFESTSDKEENILQKLILLKKTRLLAGVNENLSRQYNIIMGGASDTDLSARTLSRIEEKFRTVQQSAVVKISSENATGTIISSVAEVFQNAGFSVSDNTESEVLEVVIEYGTQKAELNRDDAEFVKWELVINIHNKQANHSFKTFMAEGRDGALSYDDALKRADFTARKNITNQFKSFLNQELLASN